MPDNNASVHYYHADTNALGGFIHSPFQQVVPIQVPLSLPPVGGYASAHTDNFRLEGIVSFRSAHTQVSGSPNKKPEKHGAPTTLASAAVEGLNVRDVLTADRIVAQVSTEHPTGNGAPVVSFTGTRFENLQISGQPQTIKLDLDLCGRDERPVKSCINNPKFLEKIKQKYNEDRPSVLCSLVTEINGKPGNSIVIPDFGTVYLAELIVDHYSYKLIMLRVELGSPVQGSMSMAAADLNGGGGGG